MERLSQRALSSQHGPAELMPDMPRAFMIRLHAGMLPAAIQSTVFNNNREDTGRAAGTSTQCQYRYKHQTSHAGLHGISVYGSRLLGCSLPG